MTMRHGDDKFGDRPEPAKGGFKLSARGIAWIAVAVVAVIFVAQNTETATVSFLWFDFSTGLWLSLSLTLVIGFLLGLWGARLIRKRHQN